MTLGQTKPFLPGRDPLYTNQPNYIYRLLYSKMEVSGALQVAEAIYNTDSRTGETLSVDERWSRGILGSAQMVAIATAAAKAIGPAISAKLPPGHMLNRPLSTFFSKQALVRWQASVEVQPTLNRIARGERFPHGRDGTIFRNREGLLPKKSYGYYREYVHPTPGVKGLGPMRVVIGSNGEVYFTPDHYRTFIQPR